MLDYRMYTFLTLSEVLNYTKAATLLCITQPAVSQHIKYLEQNLQVKLFQHNGKELQLTKQGYFLAESLKSMVADEKKLTTTLKQMDSDIQHLKFGATLTIGEFILPEKLNSFLSVHTNTSISMVVENTSVLLDMLQHGEINFAFIEGYFKKSEYAYTLLSKERFVALKGGNYNLKKEVSTIEDLLGETLIIREDGSGTREILTRILNEKNLTLSDFTRTIEIGNINAIKHLVNKNQGITFLYEAAAKEDIANKELEIIPLTNFAIEREFNFITLKNSIFQEEYNEFLRCIQQDHF